MKVETKLALNNIKKNNKRTMYTIISLILCTTLILTTMLLVSSIRNGVSENFDTEYNDYHVILKDLSAERFERIRNKEYIDKIYIKKNENAPLEKVDSSYELGENSSVYLKYKDIKEVCEYTDNIIKELNLTELEAKTINDMCKFNKKLLTVHGYIDLYINMQDDNLKCLMKINYSHIITLMIITLIIALSALFIIILYNAFLITINERKKEYAILNSVGGTEGQVLKMIFKEAIMMGVIGIIAGGMLSVLLSNIVLSSINNILNRAGYYFRLIFDIKYIMLALGIIVINIYFSILIPSLKASSTSVIQGIRNNKEIKNKKRKTILERILPTEGKVAIKNIRRNKSRYTLIMILLIINITIFISVSTYIRYEKETADLVTEYDVDAEISFYTEDTPKELGIPVQKIDYKTILKNYETKYNKKIEYIECRYRRIETLVEPTNSIMFSNRKILTYIDGKKSIEMNIVALDGKTYKKYIKKLKANEGDVIIYNNVLKTDLSYFSNPDNYTYKYYQVLNPKLNIKLKIVVPIHIDEENWDYTIVESQLLDQKYVFTNELIDGFKEFKTDIFGEKPTLFINMEMYDKLKEETYGKYYKILYNSEETLQFWNNQGFEVKIKIKCDDVIEFKNYMDKFEEDEIYVKYYTLDNQEKLMYISIIELILKVIMTAIVAIGIVSTANIMNASLIERKEDFNVLYRMGATKGNVKKILIYECIYVFAKAVVISIILSIPIIYKIIKGMENVLVLNKLLIPYVSIGIFIAVMFVISLLITLCSTRMIKEE